MTKTKMLEKMNKMQYATSFKERLLNLWDEAKIKGVPSLYYADVGSLVINDLHIDNGVGDGVFRIGVAYNTDKDFEYKRKLFHPTGVFFYEDEIKIRLYDVLAESAITYKFDNAKWCEILKDNDGNFMIGVHK